MCYTGIRYMISFGVGLVLILWSPSARFVNCSCFHARHGMVCGAGYEPVI